MEHPSEREPEPTSERPRGRNQPPRTPARAVVRELLRRHGRALTAERVVKRTGVSKQHANRLLREERRPHLVDGAEASEEEAKR